MRIATYRRDWQTLRSSPVAADLASLSHRVASTFIDRYFYSDQYNAECIDLLCDMATFYEDSELNQIAARALFGVVVERLCDDFEELQTETYNRVISQVIGFLRELPAGAELDSELSIFQLANAEQIYQRIEAIRLSPDEPLPASLQPKKILILSRITIGADVAITSIICQRMAAAFPQASISVVGNAKLAQVFSEQSNINIHSLSYARRGGLLQRFLVWLDLLAEVRRELAGLEPSEYLLLDPDSRLTQLGALPLVANYNYRFFNSRGKQGYPAKASISELTNLWLDNILGHGAFCYPKVWPDVASLAQAQILTEASGDKKLICINLGVGGNLRKQLGEEFEAALVLRLLAEANTRVILDLGFGEEERRRSETILRAAAAADFATTEVGFAELESVTPDCQLLGVECSVAEIAALIANSHEFIGYDSACQHIAAAEGVPTYTVFAGTNNVRFIRRWHACGPNTSEIVYVDTISRHEEIDVAEVIDRLMELRAS